MSNPAAIAFMLGDTSPEVIAGVRAAIADWSQQTGDRPVPLHRFMGLGGPRAARIALRDELLIEAAELLDGNPWGKCERLAKAALAFNTRRGDVWDRHGIPSDASAVDTLFFRARAFGESLPESPGQWRTILQQNASAAEVNLG